MPSWNWLWDPCSLLLQKGDIAEIRPHPPSVFPSPPYLLPSPLDIPVWFLPSEQPELIFPH